MSSANLYSKVLLNSSDGIDAGNCVVSALDMGLPEDVKVELRQCVLTGGKEQGSRLITLTVGDKVLRIVPTRAMAILDATRNGIRFGWDSPVKEVVHPSFIDQGASGGIGWLDGFNEMLVRCGYQWAGHPGEDNGEFLTLHGRIQNTPADKVVLEVEQIPPYRVALRGCVDEKRFKSTNFTVNTAITLSLDEPYIYIEDTLTNKASYDNSYQAIYHNNFGAPILEEGAKLHVAANEISPFNTYAAIGLNDWDTMPAPTENFDEMVFNVKPISDKHGFGYALMANRNESAAIEVGFNTDTLPVLTIWKNVDTVEQGYVVGIEPGTSFAYNRKHQWELGLVPTIKAKQSKTFRVRFGLLTSNKEVLQSKASIQTLQTEPATMTAEPIVKL
ncbi:aldose 1-epimerase family protein [Marinomonas balearica]|uniref:Uncharacterized protein DUF4432 n=1 Tax=Marinomonas balearica TaxID=491947 RepID=A0A4R6ME51_9GAMM|nr:aldose 1-epimerase family protein [Marinomonas balearica]TDO98960.1 uncharacterized protein DUF4432 [Marinomonas balearica]